jgi:hypothetical protein
MEFSHWVEASSVQRNVDAAVEKHQLLFVLQSWSETSAACAVSVQR